MNKDRAELSGSLALINKLKTELERAEVEAERLKKEAAGDENLINLKKSEENKKEQSLKSLEISSKQTVGEKIKVERSIQTNEQQIKTGKQEVFIKKRVIEQLERDIENMTQEIDKIKREKEDKERAVRDLEIKRDRIAS